MRQRRTGSAARAAQRAEGPVGKVRASASSGSPSPVCLSPRAGIGGAGRDQDGAVGGRWTVPNAAVPCAVDACRTGRR
jgi:hypothetical protein